MGTEGSAATITIPETDVAIVFLFILFTIYLLGDKYDLASRGFRMTAPCVFQALGD